MEATAAVLVTLPQGDGRLMGTKYDAKVTTVTPDNLADHVRGLAEVGATHLQLVLDPITAESIEQSDRCCASSTSSPRTPISGEPGTVQPPERHTVPLAAPPQAVLGARVTRPWRTTRSWPSASGPR